MIDKPFKLGEWRIDPKSGEIRSSQETRWLQPLPMAVLCRLIEAEGAVVSRNELLTDVWQGRAMSDEPINRCIAELRAALNDDRANPVYIKTLPRRGYQLLVKPEMLESSETSRPAGKPVSGWRSIVTAVAVLVFLGAVLNFFTSDWSGLRAADNTIVIRSINIDAADADAALAENIKDSLKQNISASRVMQLGEARHESAVQNNVFELNGKITEEQSELALDLWLFMPSSNRRIELGELAFSRDAWINYIAKDIGAYVVNRLAFAFDPKADNSTSAARIMSAPDYAELLTLRLGLAGHSSISVDGAARARVLRDKYPGLKIFSGLIAKSMTEGFSSHKQQEITDAVALALEEDADDPFALMSQVFLLPEENRVEGLMLLEDMAARIPYWSAPRNYAANIFLKFGYGTQAYNYTMRAAELNRIETQLIYKLAVLGMYGAAGNFDNYSEELYQRWETVYGYSRLYSYELYYGKYSEQPQLVKDFFADQWQIIYPDVDFETLSEGLFDEEVRENGLSELGKFAGLAQGRRSRALLFSLQLMYGQHADALQTYKNLKKTRGHYSSTAMWMPFATSFRQSREFHEILDIDPAFQAMYEQYGPNSFCNHESGEWQCR